MGTRLHTNMLISSLPTEKGQTKTPYPCPQKNTQINLTSKEIILYLG